MHYLDYITKGDIAMLQYCFKFKTALFFGFLVVYNCILLLIARNHLFITQASSSFKCLDMRTFMYATSTFITEAFCLVTLVQLLLMTVTVN